MRSLGTGVEAFALVTAAIALGGCLTGPAQESAGPEMALSPAALVFTSSGGATPAAQVVTVSNAAGGALAPPVTSTAYLGLEKDWLAVTVSGTAELYAISVQPSIAGIPVRPGPNLASISVDCPGASNTPLAISVQLVVK